MQQINDIIFNHKNFFQDKRLEEENEDNQLKSFGQLENTLNDLADEIQFMLSSLKTI